MEITIIDRFEIEGRGTVFTCYLPEIKTYKEASELINQIFEYNSDVFQVNDVEMSRGGLFDHPKRKQLFALAVKQLRKENGCGCSCHFFEGTYHDKPCCNL